MLDSRDVDLLERARRAEVKVPNTEVVEMVDIPQLDEEATLDAVEPKKVQDQHPVAVKLGILGCGQGGGNLADAFWGVGYRRVAALNTTARDLIKSSIPEKNRHILQSPGGAGKDPSVGKQLAEAESEEIFALIKRSFGDDAEQILVCVGAGGGTGTGSCLPAIQVAKKYLKQIGQPESHVGVMVTLPTKDESAAVQKNALEVILPLLDMAEKKEISPLVIVDNARVMALYGKASVLDVWSKANKNIVGLFDMFNRLSAAQDESVVVTCDPQDFKTVLRGGVLTFGRTKLENPADVTAVATAVRDNVKKGLLVEGMDLSKATTGAGILAGGGLEAVSQEALEAAFASLNRLMSQSGETKLHRGVYNLGSGALYVYTMLAGLGRPEQRLKEIAAKAGATL